jgi:adenosylhomocysteine nucleosidase
MSTVVLISATTEWQTVRACYPAAALQESPFGAWFTWPLRVTGAEQPVIFLHGGWGKIAAAASTQYAIDRWSPTLLVNLGTCGGFAGAARRGELILAERTLVYDIVEQMLDPQAAIAHYTTSLDLSWLREPYPQPVRRTLLISGDRDLIVEELPKLQATYGATVGDWESGAIAWVAARNGIRCLILRFVTDLVGVEGGEAYDGSGALFADQTALLLPRLLAALPAWLECAQPTTDAG